MTTWHVRKIRRLEIQIPTRTRSCIEHHPSISLDASIVYIKILPTICVMYSCVMEKIRIPIHKTNQLNIYEPKWNSLQLNNDKYVLYLEYVLEYLIYERGHEIDTYNY